MEHYSKKLEVRWADLDPNFHVLHSKYYDFGAFCRMSFMNEHGLTLAFLMENKIGPVIFQEECVFRKEIKFGDEVEVTLQASWARADFGRWALKHEIFANGNRSAEIVLSGGWIDMVKRKLAHPPSMIHEVFNQIPKAEGFTFLDK